MPSYRPVNMPAKYETFPMPAPPGHGASAEETEDEAKRSVTPSWRVETWARCALPTLRAVAVCEHRGLHLAAKDGLRVRALLQDDR